MLLHPVRTATHLDAFSCDRTTCRFDDVALPADGFRSTWGDDVHVRPADFRHVTVLIDDGGRLLHLFAMPPPDGSNNSSARNAGWDRFIRVAPGQAAERVVVTDDAAIMRRSRGADPWAQAATFVVAHVDGDARWTSDGSTNARTARPSWTVGSSRSP
jgi:hypothetical protein